MSTTTARLAGHRQALAEQGVPDSVVVHGDFSRASGFNAAIVERGVPGIGLDVRADRYFWYHHTEGDTLDKLDPEEVALCVAVMAVMAYVVADLPEALMR